ncbi:hypothetical protein [Mycolicibacterium sp. lyk4-40-TYG-92]|uniref:hypothetical protein n=1 Tax=Mycolicibacterium sp. lyk4-40-TYG-92 TaxID=3040295 RepID=UPI00254F5CB3|nr:hypothetical protein [Mycolicibacterium sp. lyk4-40-TYG-92]
MLTLLRSNNIERTNDLLVGRRCDWTTPRVRAEYARWSGAALGVAAAIETTPLAGIPVPLAELGRFRLGLILCGAMTFDHHTHLRFDMAPALNRPAPPTDGRRMSLVLQWMFAVLGNQWRMAPPANFTRPLRISLRGPGASEWILDSPGGVRSDSGGPADTTVFACATEFPEWATQRANWRSRDVSIVGDQAYAEHLLDQINVV